MPTIKQMVKNIIDGGSKAKTKDETWVQHVQKRENPQPPDNPTSPAKDKNVEKNTPTKDK